VSRVFIVMSFTQRPRTASPGCRFKAPAVTTQQVALRGHMSELRKYLIDELTGSKSGIEQARSWLVQHPQDAAAAVDLLVHDLKTVTSHARCLNVLYAPP
jgi:hypothetical protein